MKICFALASIFLSVFLVKGCDDGLINFSVTLWIGDDINSSNTKSLEVPEGSSVYEALKLAAEQDSNYAVKSRLVEDRNYIYQIGEEHENCKENTFWMFYVLHRNPNNNKPPAGKDLSEIGVDDTHVEEGQHYLLWLRSHPTCHCN